VIEDYQMSNDMSARGVVESRLAAALYLSHGVLPCPLLLDALITAQPDYLVAALKAVRDQYGSVDCYVSEALGFTPEIRETVRRQFQGNAPGGPSGVRKGRGGKAERPTAAASEAPEHPVAT
jgi:hypothetical protein